MAEKIKLDQGDTRPQVKVTLTDDVTGEPVDVTGATPRLKFRAAGGTLLSTITGTVLDGPAGVVVFLWGDGTLDVDAGDYEGEVEITFSDGTGGGVQTVYDALKFRVREQF